MKTSQTLLFFFFTLIISTPSVFEQQCSDYPCVIKKEKKAISDKNYQMAFDNLESADG